MGEAYLPLHSILEKFLEFVRGTSAKEKDFQELASKREEEKNEAQDLALKYNEVVIQHNNLLDRIKTLQNENDKLAKVYPCIISLSNALAVFRLGLAFFEIIVVGP